MDMSSKRPVVRVWVSKYALTSGITEHDAEIASERMCVVQGRYPQHYHKGQWHRTEAEAIARAEQMRKAKLAALRKALARLEQLKF